MTRYTKLIILFIILVVAPTGLALPTGTPATDEKSKLDSADEITVVSELRKTDVGHLALYNENENLIKRYDWREEFAYTDIDPLPSGRYDVLVGAYNTVHSDDRCGDHTPPCTQNYLIEANLSTGETEIIYKTIWPRSKGAELHDADKIGEHEYLIADIYHGRIFIYNSKIESVTWQWNFSSAYGPETGGPPGDWTHLNDVEMLPDGTIMASPRNFDSVVFIDRDRGLLRNWTLGSDGDHDILYEQHNPDWLGRNRVIVADSENNRIVQFRRVNGQWIEEWSYTEIDMHWPRDADRLRNGHTLITDSHGDRVFEINRTGHIVWSVDVKRPYEAERLFTRDESFRVRTPEPTATDSGTPTDGSKSASATPDGDRFTPIVTQYNSDESLAAILKRHIPTKPIHGLMWVLPDWMGYWTIIGGLFAIVSSVAGGCVWLGYRYQKE